MIYKTFAVAFIFAIVFASEVKEGYAQKAANLGKKVAEGTLELGKKAVTGTFGYAKEGFKKLSKSNADIVERLKVDTEHNKEIVEQIQFLINKFQAVMSQVQKEAKCPASPEVNKANFKAKVDELTKKYLEPLKAEMEKAMDKLPAKIKVLFQKIMDDFQGEMHGNSLTEITEEQLKNILMYLKDKYEDQVKEAMKEEKARFEKEVPATGNSEEEEKRQQNMIKLQKLMQRFEGATSPEDVMRQIRDPTFVGDVTSVVGKKAFLKFLFKANEALDDVEDLATKAQCVYQAKEEF